MRPVGRGARGTYGYDIDLSSYANLQTSLGNYTLNFNAAAVVNLIGANPTMWNILLVWLWVTSVDAGQAVAPPNIADYRAALTTIKNRIDDQYRTAANPLITNLGRFCSYCEKPQPSPLSVEHIAPKDNYPLFALAWDNFMLSCTVCNVAGTGKGTDPQRVTVAGWGAPPANELDYYTRIRATYLWPDDQLAYRNLVPQLQYQRQAPPNAWVPVPAQQSARAGMTITASDYTTRRNTANIYLDGTNNLYSRDVRVMLVPAGGNAATNALGLLKLNSTGIAPPPNPPTSDGRMFDRTKAWFTAVGMLDATRYLVGQPWQNWWATVPTLAAAVGYFSVWVRVLELMNVNVPGTANPLLGQFLTDVTASTYPGTDATAIP